MFPTDRRTFLRVLSSSALAAALPASIDRALAIQANNQNGSIQDIEHIVILMQENQSFDHYFGTLRGVRGFRRSASGLAPIGKTRLASAGRQRISSAVPSQRQQSGLQVPRRHAAQLAGFARRMEQRQIRRLGREQGPRDHVLSHAQGHSVSLRARRRLHPLRRLLLLAHGLNRSQPLSRVDGLVRQ